MKAAVAAVMGGRPWGADMTTMLLVLMLSTGAPIAHGSAESEGPAANTTMLGGERDAHSTRRVWLDANVGDGMVRPSFGPKRPLVDAGALGFGQSAGAARRDSLWNGILIGAALGVVSLFTTAAEAPPSGKVAIVVMSAALGGYIDSRLEVKSPYPVWGRSGPRLAVLKAVRF